MKEFKDFMETNDIDALVREEEIALGELSKVSGGRGLLAEEIADRDEVNVRSYHLLMKTAAKSKEEFIRLSEQYSEVYKRWKAIIEAQTYGEGPVFLSKMLAESGIDLGVEI